MGTVRRDARAYFPFRKSRLALISAILISLFLFSLYPAAFISHYWYLDLAVQLLPLLVIPVLLLTLPVLVIGRSWSAGIIFITATLIITFSQFSHCYNLAPIRDQNDVNNQPSLSLLFCNVGRQSDAKFREMLSWAAQQDVDFVGYVEGTESKLLIAKEFSKHWPYQTPGRLATHGVYLSKYPVEQHAIYDDFSAQVARAPRFALGWFFSSRRVLIDGEPVFDWFMLHWRSPRNQIAWSQGLELASLSAQAIREVDHLDQQILVGDFNATPDSLVMSRLLEGLPDHQRATTATSQGTWPAWLPAWYSVAIDHAIVSSEIVVHESKVMENYGSDHRPLLIKFKIKKGLDNKEME